MSRVEDARTALAQAECLVGATEVDAAWERLAAAVRAEYADKNPLLLAVMIGGLVAAAEIGKRLAFAFELDYLHATRYRGETQGAGLVWKRHPQVPLEGRHVLVIDDILDEGHTLVAIRAALEAERPASLKVAVLAKKHHARCVPEAQAEFIGLELPDRYVFGCGMDYREYWRQLPAIYALAADPPKP